jgi:uncharacterized membrane protein
MKAGDFLKQVRHDRVVAAIRDAETKTSGEIRVFISRKPVEDPVAAAQGHFLELGMQKTRDRNAVLIFLAPHSRKFAVIGDEAVHARCGEAFWRTLAAELSAHFQKSDFTGGLVHGIKTAGDLLARHFPRQPDDRNELPDQIASD